MNHKESDAHDMRGLIGDAREQLKTVLVCADLDMDGKTKCAFCREMVRRVKDDMIEWMARYDQLDAEELNA